MLMLEDRKQEIAASLEMLRALKNDRYALEPRIAEAAHSYKMGMAFSVVGLALTPVLGLFLLVALMGSFIIFVNGFRLSRLQKELGNLHTRIDRAQLRLNILSGRNPR
jgi:hypothetical protein